MYNIKSFLFFFILPFSFAVINGLVAKAETAIKPPTVGELAPDFTLGTGGKESISLSQYRGKKNVVLYFYPKDNTPGCTTEAENFNKTFEQFQAADTVILGVSVDNQKSHFSFTKKLSLKFALLSDVGGKVARQYDAMGWIMTKRVTYVINKNGHITHIMNNVDVSTHAKDVLRLVQTL